MSSRYTGFSHKDNNRGARLLHHVAGQRLLLRTVIHHVTDSYYTATNLQQDAELQVMLQQPLQCDQAGPRYMIEAGVTTQLSKG